MKRFFILTCALIAIYSQTCFSEIMEASDFKGLFRLIQEHVEDDCIILLDVDDVLIAPTEEFDFRHPI